jgi:hypothetical protein
MMVPWFRQIVMTQISVAAIDFSVSYVLVGGPSQGLIECPTLAAAGCAFIGHFLYVWTYVSHWLQHFLIFVASDLQRVTNTTSWSALGPVPLCCRI